MTKPIFIAKQILKRINKVMAEILPQPVLLDHDDMTYLALAANDCITIVNGINDKSTNTVEVGYGAEVMPTFDGTDIRNLRLGTPFTGMYPLIDILLNGKFVEAENYRIVPIFHIVIDLEPPRAAWWLRTDAVLDGQGEYNLADNESPHGPLYFNDGTRVFHPAYLDALTNREIREPLDSNQANELITLLDLPKTLLIQRLNELS